MAHKYKFCPFVGVRDDFIASDVHHSFSKFQPFCLRLLIIQMNNFQVRECNPPQLNMPTKEVELYVAGMEFAAIIPKLYWT